MSNVITRWECPECSWRPTGKPRGVGPHDRKDLRAYNAVPCPGVPVERTYIAVDALLGDEARAAAIQASGTGPVTPAYVRARQGWGRSIRAAINAVTGTANEEER